MRRRRLGFSLAALGALALTGAEARADDCEPIDGFSRCIDVDNLWARPGNAPFFGTGTTLTTPPGQVAFGLVGSYQRRPYRLVLPGASLEPRQVYVVDNAFDATFLFALGVTNHLELTIAAPVTFYQDGAGYSATSGDDEVLSRSVVRDPRLGVLVTFLDRDRSADADGFALAGRFEIAAPLGDGEAFAGARTATFVPAVTASYRFDRLEAAAEVGARVRGEAPLGSDVWGTQLTTSLGVNVRLYDPIGLSASAEAWALPVLAEQSEGSSMLVPAEWLASVRAAPLLSGDLYFQAGAGSSIPLTTFAATSPEVRAVFALGYAPLGLDSDADGVLDRDDRCTDSREDRDGFKDDDGCLDPDNDEDRIPDALDRCRDAAETVDNFKDDDGCPDLDDDGDGVPDEEDGCRNDPEDKDGTDDADGCPDLDDDADGIPDTQDTCRKSAEDKDGYADQDGCPDLDDDADGVPDASDKCQGKAEDQDRFADDDGCPDPDNDQDGVLDGSDLCPTEAETLDGNADGDGCPEPGATTLVRMVGDGFVLDVAARFKPKSAEVGADLALRLGLVAKLVKGLGPDAVLVVEGFPDDGKAGGGEDLGQRRAAAAKKAIVAAGLAGASVTATAGDLSVKRAANAPHLELRVVRSGEH